MKFYMQGTYPGQHRAHRRGSISFVPESPGPPQPRRLIFDMPGSHDSLAKAPHVGRLPPVESPVGWWLRI